ncbi:MAG: hypothetical protein WKF55_03230 [Gemmatimonadaceae bacterium]
MLIFPLNSAPGGEWRRKRHAEPGVELGDVGERAPDARARRVKGHMLFDAVGGGGCCPITPLDVEIEEDRTILYGFDTTDSMLAPFCGGKDLRSEHKRISHSNEFAVPSDG